MMVGSPAPLVETRVRFYEKTITALKALISLFKALIVLIELMRILFP